MINKNTICEKLKSERCKIHGEHPSAILEGESIVIAACCEDFHQELEAIMDREMGKQMDSLLDFGFDENV